MTTKRKTPDLLTRDELHELPAAEDRFDLPIADTVVTLTAAKATKGQGNPALEQAFKNIDDVLRKEAGCASELDYRERTSWLLFLKYLDGLEQGRAAEAELEGKLALLLRLKYSSIEDAAASLGAPADIRRVFIDFRRFLYEKVRAA